MFEVLSFIIDLIFQWFYGFFMEWKCFFGTLFVGFIAYLLYKAHEFGKIEKGSFYDR